MNLCWGTANIYGALVVNSRPTDCVGSKMGDSMWGKGQERRRRPVLADWKWEYPAKTIVSMAAKYIDCTASSAYLMFSESHFSFNKTFDSLEIFVHLTKRCWDHWNRKGNKMYLKINNVSFYLHCKTNDENHNTILFAGHLSAAAASFQPHSAKKAIQTIDWFARTRTNSSHYHASLTRCITGF